MKSKLIKLVACAVLFICLNPLQTKAQVSGSTYKIVNRLLCDIDVFYELGCPSYFSTTVIIPPGGSFLITGFSSSIPPSSTDVFVWLTKVAGVDVTWGSNMYAVWSLTSCYGPAMLSNGAPFPPSVPPSCSPNNPNYNLQWTPTQCIIQ